MDSLRPTRLVLPLCLLLFFRLPAATDSDCAEAERWFLAYYYSPDPQAFQGPLDQLLGGIETDEALRRKFSAFVGRTILEELADTNLESGLILGSDEIKRETLFGVLKSHRVAPDAGLAISILKNQASLNRSVFNNAFFLKFSKSFHGDPAFLASASETLAKLGSMEMDAFFAILRFTDKIWGREFAFRILSDKYLGKKELDIDMLAGLAGKLADFQDTWGAELRKAVYPQLGRRLLELPVNDWLKLDRKMTWELAGYSGIPTERFLTKLMDHLRKSLDTGQDREPTKNLIKYLITDQGRSAYGETCKSLMPYFRNDFGVLSAMHGVQGENWDETEDLMSFLIEDEDCLLKSSRILAGFLKHPDNWGPGMYQVAKHYYVKYPESRKVVFSDIFRPLYEKGGQAGAPLQWFLKDIHDADPFLSPEHQLTLARFLLQGDNWKATFVRGPDGEAWAGIVLASRVYARQLRSSSGRSAALEFLDVTMPELTDMLSDNLFGPHGKTVLASLEEVLAALKEVHGRFRGIRYRDLKVLAYMNGKINHELERNLKDGGIPGEVRKTGLVRIMGLMVRIANILQDEEHLYSIVDQLRKDIFNLDKSSDSCKPFKLSSSGLAASVGRFRSIDRSLRDAAASLENPAGFTRVLHRKFYLPLIYVEGLLDSVYQYQSPYGTELPFEWMLKQLDFADLEAAYLGLRQRLTCVTDDLRARSGLTRLLDSYFTGLKVNPWTQPELFPLSANANLFVFKDVLEAKAGRLRQDYRYREILELFLNNPPKDGKGRTADDQLSDVCAFVQLRLLEPYELLAYPLRAEDGSGLKLEEILDEKNTFAIRQPVSNRDKVNGHYRLRLLNLARKHLPNSPQRGTILSGLAIMLPNSPGNSSEGKDALKDYAKAKREVFQEISARMKRDGAPAPEPFIQMLRLERSMAGESLGFEEFLEQCRGRLGMNLLPILMEKIKFQLRSQGPDGKASLRNYFLEMDTLIAQIRAVYGIKPFDPLGYSIRKMRDMRQGKAHATKPVNPSELEEMYFLINYFKSGLQSALTQATRRSQFEAILRGYEQLIELYNHFLPFMYDFDLRAVTAQEHDVLFLTLLDRQLKASLLSLKSRACERLPQDDCRQIERKYDSIIPYLLTHNLANLDVVFSAVERRQLDVFKFKKEIHFQLFNFDLLYEVRETRVLDAKAFVDEAFGGFELNMEMVSSAGDSTILEYFFGDFRSRILPNLRRSADSSNLRNFDDAVQKVVRLSLSGDVPEPVRSQLKAFLDDPAGRLSGGFKRLSTWRSFGNLWNDMATKVGEEATRPGSFFEGYQRFYGNAMFEKWGGQEACFRKEIDSGFVAKFSREKGQAVQRANVLETLDGLQATLKGNAGPACLYVEAYRRALVDLMRKALLGFGLSRGAPYVASDIFDNQAGGEGAAKALTDSLWASRGLFDLYDWIYDGDRRFSSTPSIKTLFGRDESGKSLQAVFKRSVDLFIEEKERQFVEELDRADSAMSKRISGRSGPTAILNEFQRDGEGQVLSAYGGLVRLRRDHNGRVEARSLAKANSFPSSPPEQEALLGFYRFLKVGESDVSRYANRWRHILFSIVPFSRFLGLQGPLPELPAADPNRSRLYFFYYLRLASRNDAVRAHYAGSGLQGDFGSLENYLEREVGLNVFQSYRRKGDTVQHMKGEYPYEVLRRHGKEKASQLVLNFLGECEAPASLRGGMTLCKYYNRKKLPAFLDLARETQWAALHGNPETYLPVLFFASRTFPYVSAYSLTDSADNFSAVYKYQGDLKNSEEATPYGALEKAWQALPPQYHCPDMLEHTVGVLFLPQAERIDATARTYTVTTNGGRDFIQKYAALKMSTRSAPCLSRD
jgi:hypothetical protein